MSNLDKDFEDRLKADVDRTDAAAARLGALVKERREQAGLSQADLAALAKSSQQTIDRIERGETKHSRAFPRVLAALKIENDPTFTELAVSEARLEDAISAELRDRFPDHVKAPGFQDHDSRADVNQLSVYTLEAHDELRYRFLPFAVDYLGRPEPLRRVRRGYAMLVPDDRNYPTLRAGDILLVNPHIPVRADNEAIITQIVRSEKASYSIIATIVSMDADSYTVRHGVGEPYRLLKTEWDFANLVVGKFNRV